MLSSNDVDAVGSGHVDLLDLIAVDQRPHIAVARLGAHQLAQHRVLLHIRGGDELAPAGALKMGPGVAATVI